MPSTTFEDQTKDMSGEVLTIEQLDPDAREAVQWIRDLGHAVRELHMNRRSDLASSMARLATRMASEFTAEQPEASHLVQDVLSRGEQPQAPQHSAANITGGVMIFPRPDYPPRF